jgi:type IV secretory pathway TrbL component
VGARQISFLCVRHLRVMPSGCRVYEYVCAGHACQALASAAESASSKAAEAASTLSALRAAIEAGRAREESLKQRLATAATQAGERAFPHCMRPF